MEMEEKEYFQDGFVCDLESTDKKEAIHELINKLPMFCSMKKKDDFEIEVLKREERQSTGLGRGIAVAHGHSHGDNIIIGLGCSCRGIDYKSIDNAPVTLLFIIANPQEKKCEYLRLLSALVKLLRNQEFRNNILACSRGSDKEKFIRDSFLTQLQQEKTCAQKSA